MNQIIFDKISDQRGHLISLEVGKNIPFEIKRVYYLYGLSDKPRGFHAHLKLKQFLICINGSCKIVLNNGFSSSEVFLQNPNEGILLDNFLWHEMHNFSKDCVLLILASELYDENDYIRNYDDFLKITKERGIIE